MKEVAIGPSALEPGTVDVITSPIATPPATLADHQIDASQEASRDVTTLAVHPDLVHILAGGQRVLPKIVEFYQAGLHAQAAAKAGLLERLRVAQTRIAAIEGGLDPEYGSKEFLGRAKNDLDKELNDVTTAAVTQAKSEIEERGLSTPAVVLTPESTLKPTSKSKAYTKMAWQWTEKHLGWAVLRGLEIVAYGAMVYSVLRENWFVAIPLAIIIALGMIASSEITGRARATKKWGTFIVGLIIWLGLGLTMAILRTQQHLSNQHQSAVRSSFADTSASSAAADASATNIGVPMFFLLLLASLVIGFIFHQRAYHEALASRPRSGNEPSLPEHRRYKLQLLTDTELIDHYSRWKLLALQQAHKIAELAAHIIAADTQIRDLKAQAVAAVSMAEIEINNTIPTMFKTAAATYILELARSGGADTASMLTAIPDMTNLNLPADQELLTKVKEAFPTLFGDPNQAALPHEHDLPRTDVSTRGDAESGVEPSAQPDPVLLRGMTPVAELAAAQQTATGAPR